MVKSFVPGKFITFKKGDQLDEWVFSKHILTEKRGVSELE